MVHGWLFSNVSRDLMSCVWFLFDSYDFWCSTDCVNSTSWLSTCWFWSGQLLVLLVLPASVLRPGLSDPAGLGTQSLDRKEAATGSQNHRSCRPRQRCADSPRRPSPLSGNLGLWPGGTAGPRKQPHTHYIHILSVLQYRPTWPHVFDC